MRVYKPTHIRPWSVASALLRSIASLLNVWPLLLIAFLLLSPVGPCLRMQYTYVQHGNVRWMLSCDYLGGQGWVRGYVDQGECPVVAIIDRREWQ